MNIFNIKDFHQNVYIESRCATGPENILFAGACMHLSARKFLQAGSVKGLAKKNGTSHYN